MKRHLMLLLIAIVVGAFSLVPVELHQAKPVHATGPCGDAGDAYNFVYQDWYSYESYRIYDTYDGQLKWVNTDQASYRYNNQADNHCYRAYYTSVWCACGAYFHAHLRAWLCGSGPYEWDSGTYWTTRADTVTYQWRLAGLPYLTLQVNTPGGSRPLDFQDYNVQGPICLPQMDQYSSDVWSPTWTSHPTSTGQGSGFYCWQDNNGAHCS